ncbi:MAG: protease pro-enzyme activation domain-containing protein, partial [Candidatus Eremiobacteraeota bacterium]|nr:protease pro-enzyme activation domain-containing protein [Candidatus Eremiobacteraeota bacterium]
MIRFARLRALAALGMLAMSAAACGGGGGTTTVPSSGNPVFSTASIPSQLLIKDWGQAALQNAQYVGPASNAFLSVNVLVHQQSAQALLQYAQDVNNPSSANFRKWLAPQDLAARFGASISDYQAAADYFAQQGLVVGAWPQRMMLSVSGGQSTMERAFNTKFGVYRANGQTFVGPISTPHFSKVVPVDAVGHLVAYSSMHSYLMSVPRAGSSVNLGYSPQQVRAAFDLNGAYSKTYDGRGVTIAVIGTGPIAVGGTSGDKDLDGLAALYNVNVANVVQVPVTANGVAAGLQKSGIPTTAPGSTPLPPNATPTPLANGFPFSNAFQSPPPVAATPCAGSLPSCNPEDAEAQLDVQQAASLAPGATVDFYLAYNAADCFTYFSTSCATTGSNQGQPVIGLNEADAEIQQVIADAANGSGPDIISMSYGGGESQQFPRGNADYSTSYYHLEFAALVSEGIAAFASSGDSGSAECLNGAGGYLPQVCVSYPSGDPFVVSVGG